MTSSPVARNWCCQRYSISREGIVTWSHTKIYKLCNDLLRTTMLFLLLIGNLSPYQITRHSAGLQLHGNSFPLRPFSTLRYFQPFTHPLSIIVVILKIFLFFFLLLFLFSQSNFVTSLEKRIVDVFCQWQFATKKIIFSWVIEWESIKLVPIIIKDLFKKKLFVEI